MTEQKQKKRKIKLSELTATWRRVGGYLRPYRGQFVLALVCMTFFGATDGGIPFLVKHILDDVFGNQDKTMLYVLPGLLIAFALLRALVDFGQQFLMARIGHNITRDIRNDMNTHLLKMGSDFYLRKSVGDILSRFTSDVILVKDLLTTSVASVIRDLIRVVALLCAAVYLDPKLATFAFIGFLFGFWPVYKFGKKMRKISKRGQDTIGSLSGIIQENVLGQQIVKIFGREKYEEERFDKENNLLNKTFIKAEKIRAITGPTNEVMACFAIAAVILYGGSSVIGGIRSQGDFISFLISIFLLYDPFKQLSRINNQLQQGMTGAERIFELLDIVPTIREAEKTVPLGATNDIEINNVSFSYASDKAPALSEINLKIKEGSKVALVGFSGAGKSTLVALLPRFIDPTSGEVLVGGTDIKNASISELRSRIAMVTQHTFLFNDTIYNNIAYGKENATEAEVMEAARTAYAYDFIMALPEGFQTVVGESGLSLSGGERQRIAIARAVLKDAPILILDEATASLDNKSEREVQAALERLTHQRTTLVIAHRLSTIQSADQIVVMESGRIVEIGTHDVLLAKGGAFAKLHALQFSKNEAA